MEISPVQQKLRSMLNGRAAGKLPTSIEREIAELDDPEDQVKSLVRDPVQHPPKGS